MACKHHKPEEIVAKLRQVEVLVGQGKPMAEGARAIDHQHSVRTQKQVWKYHRVGQNRFRNRITVEHGRVVG